MCGIVGYTGVQSALDVVLAQLGRVRRLEHDACGVAVLADGGLACSPPADSLPALTEALRTHPLPTGGSGIGLSRDARDAPENAGPQLDEAGRVAVALIGEPTNGPALAEELTERGHPLRTGTVGEAVARLLAEAFSSAYEPAEAARQLCRALDGDFALLALHADAPDTVVAARRGLPLTVGLGAGEALLASDAAALEAQRPQEVVSLDTTPGEQVVLLRREWDEVRCEITDAEGGVLRA
ncbi:class II glutamine amidotransferase domain-containing protein [Streptomyces triticirhizae]|uniref:Glutamine--fructose-6-phosphate aminotransferase [isomerizing] n=1 Tax=Streptomyces triticirhizae TaxID=2483353 RepID=A0A3M2M8L5_9ACTN|nr:glucosamine--fructose-6-phosphate aminotransferase [Streptomyces triticirhizae]RMI45819.1 glucosamine--fructose-6-phosphate aminotransferase [Streptomyces triticirhizae]